jgi:hypothetical protein
MTVTEISIWLFGKPSFEMNIEGGSATPKMLREKAVELKKGFNVLLKSLKN